MGDLGMIGPPVDFVAKLINLTLYSLGCVWLHRKHLQILCGRWVRLFMFRRPVMGNFSHVWRALSSGTHFVYMTQPIRREFLLSLALLPCCRMDLRSPVDGMVTASDASLHGGAVVCSEGVTAYGKHRISELLQAVHTSPNVAVVAINDPLGSAYRGFELLRSHLAFFAHWNWHDSNDRVLQYTCGHFIRLPALEPPQVRIVRQAGISVTTCVLYAYVDSFPLPLDALYGWRCLQQHWSTVVVEPLWVFPGSALPPWYEKHLSGLGLSFAPVPTTHNSGALVVASRVLADTLPMRVAGQVGAGGLHSCQGSLEDLEVAMGFLPRHTLLCQRTRFRKAAPSELAEERWHLLEHSAPPVLLSSYFQHWLPSEVVESASLPPDLEGFLASHLVRSADCRGSDIRLDS
eukprot:6492591-Amphidinium_carterae.1